MYRSLIYLPESYNSFIYSIYISPQYINKIFRKFKFILSFSINYFSEEIILLDI